MNESLVQIEQVDYLKDKDLIVVGHYCISPEKLLDALDQCLLMRLYKIKLHKIAKMSEYINKHLDLVKRLERAEDSFELRKIQTIKNVMKEIRHAIKLTEMEENRIKSEMLERQEGE